MSYYQTTTSKIANMATKPIINAGLVYLGSMVLGIDFNMNNPIFAQ